MGWVIYSTKRVKYGSHNTTTQPQHATTNMSRCRPPSSGFGPLPTWVGQRRRQLMAPPLPMGLKQARGVQCALAIAGSVNWSVGIGRTKK